MRIIELTTGPNIYLNNEETALLKKFKKGPVPRKELTEHEQIIAHQLVIKDMLTRKKVEGKTIFEKVLEE